LLKDRLLETAGLIAIDCSGQGSHAPHIVKAIGTIRSYHPTLIILLIDGALDQALIAQAFRHGVSDYFRWPYPPGLLAERIRALCRARSS
jgi:hypothetical protein